MSSTGQKSMSWWRCYHGAPYDPKWALVARKLGALGTSVRPGEVWAVASCLYDTASKAAPRGALAAVDLEEIAVALGFDEDLVVKIFDGLRDKAVHDGAIIIAWEKRQPARERTDNTATERKQRQRSKSKVRAPEGDGARVRAPEQGENANDDGHAMSRHVTPRHAASHPVTPRGEESREDESREDSHTLSLDAARGDAWPHGPDLGVVKAKRHLRKVFDQVVAAYPVGGNTSIADGWAECQRLFAAGELPGPVMLVACAREYPLWQGEENAARAAAKPAQAAAIPVSLANWFGGKRWEALAPRALARLQAEQARRMMIGMLTARLSGPITADLIRAFGGEDALLGVLAQAEILDGVPLRVNFHREFILSRVLEKHGEALAAIPAEILVFGVADKVVPLHKGKAP